MAGLVRSASALALAAALALSATPALGHFESQPYSFDSGSMGTCSDHVDPITIVFYGFTATRDNTRAVVQTEMGWSGDTSAAGQWASSHNYCSTMDGQSYNGCGTCNRDHLRYNQTHDKDLKNRYETVGTPHREIWQTCGHAVVGNGFNAVRDVITQTMVSNGHGFTQQYWGNIEQQRQCDQSLRSSDGFVNWLNIGGG